MKTFGVTCVLIVGITFFTDGARADDPFDFNKVHSDIAQNGLQPVINQLGTSNPLLVAALTHVQPYLHDDPHQLWFQMQARTRIQGWEDFQRQMRAQTPDDTLIALTSSLEPIPSGFEQPPALPNEPTVRQHGISPDGAWEAQFSKRSFKVIQLGTGQTREFKLNDNDAAAIGEITSIALNTAGGYATIGGTLPVVLHYQLRSGSTKVVKLADTDKNRFDHYEIHARGPGPTWRVIVTPDTKHAVLWGRKNVASFSVFTGANEFKAEAPVRHFGRRYGFLGGERMAINYQAAGRKGRIEGILIYDLANGKQVANLEHGASQVGIAINMATDTILTSGPVVPGYARNASKLLFWNAGTGERVERALPDIYGNVIGISEDGERFLTLSLRPAVVFVWDMRTKKMMHRFDLGIDVVRGRLDGSTLIVTQESGRKQTEHWFEYHRGK